MTGALVTGLQPGCLNKDIIMKKGFTLLELLITIIILGILAAIAIPIYTSSVERARGDACISNIRTILSAWQIYNMKNTTPYDPNETFRAVPTINNAFGITISENNFGNSELTDYGFIMDFTPGTPSYEIKAYRQNGPYSGYIIECEYTPNGVTIGGITYYYRWFENWPWMPNDE